MVDMRLSALQASELDIRPSPSATCVCVCGGGGGGREKKGDQAGRETLILIDRSCRAPFDFSARDSTYRAAGSCSKVS